MKKIPLLLSAAVLAAGVSVAAAADDPLVPLSYLTGTYSQSLLSQAQQRIDSGTQAVYDRVVQNSGTSGGTSGLSDDRYKQGDAITLSTGSGTMLLAGQASVRFASGAVIDVTDGKTVPSGTVLVPRHRYLAAENTTAVLSVTSPTAVVSLEGSTTLAPSASTDYNALADALARMGLFAGTGTAYGSGYDLEVAATRVEGVVMFLRLIGEEKAAQAYTGPCPFADVPDWATHYVGYAYSKGYTAGVGPDAAGNPVFGTQRLIGAPEYVTFLLRSLGYRDTGSAPDFTWQTALTRAAEFGVLTQGEARYFGSLSSFLRAHVAYLSYFGLDAPMAGGSGTLLDTLVASGALDRTTVDQARAAVTVTRIS